MRFCFGPCFVGWALAGLRTRKKKKKIKLEIEMKFGLE
jgi:hypothetical protein